MHEALCEQLLAAHLVKKFLVSITKSEHLANGLHDQPGS